MKDVSVRREMEEAFLLSVQTEEVIPVGAQREERKWSEKMLYSWRRATLLRTGLNYLGVGY